MPARTATSCGGNFSSPAFPSESSNEFFGLWAAQFHDAGGGFVGVVGKVEDLGISDGSIGIVVHLKADDAAIGRCVCFGFNVLAAEEIRERVAAGTGDIQGLFVQRDVFTFPLVSGFVEEEQGQTAYADDSSEPGVYEIQADTDGNNKD